MKTSQEGRQVPAMDDHLGGVAPNGLSDADSDCLHSAAEWWLRLREPDVSPNTVAEWLLWCEASAHNQEAFERVQSLWHKAKAAPLKLVSAVELRADRARGRLVPWAIAASLILGALLAVPWLKERVGQHIENGAGIASTVGVNREVILPDSSHVILGGATALRAVYTPDRRTVVLNSGEAFFRVRPDHNRPFVVQTPSGAVTVLGTAFNVRTDDKVLRVAVSEGVVEVSAPGRRLTSMQGPQGVTASAGQQVLVDATAVAVLSTVNPRIATSWTSGTLKFIDEPLDSVIAAVNRYSPTRIELRRAGLEHLRYTGTVVAGRIDEWLAALPNAFPLEVVSQDSDRVIIRSRE